jgi:hypothetical protein
MLANREVGENLAVRAGLADYAVIASIDKRAIHSCAARTVRAPGFVHPPYY